MRDRIAYIASVLPARSETFVYREIRALRNRGWQVFCISLYEGESLADSALGDIFEQRLVLMGWSHTMKTASWALIECLCHPLRFLAMFSMVLGDCASNTQLTSVSEWFKHFYRAVLSLAVASFLRRNQVRHLHCHFAHSPTSVGMYAAKQLGIPFTFTGHANDIGPRQSLLRKKLQRSGGVACISQWHEKFYRGLWDHGNYKIVRCGLDTREWNIAKARSRGQVTRFITVARLVPKKGIDLLLHSLASLSNDRALEWQLEVIGDGPQEVWLKNLANSLGISARINWHGALENWQVRERLIEADVFALACRVDSRGDRDGIPVVLMEAMACGIPVITGDIESIRDLVLHEKTGLCVDAEDTSAFATALLHLAKDDSLRQRLRNAALLHVETEFDGEVNIVRLEGLFSSCHRRMDNLRLGYLNTRYPALSHTFIEREVTAVRSEGIIVKTFSVRSAEGPDLLTEAHKQAALETFVLQPNVRTLIGTLLVCALSSPFATSKVLTKSMRIRPPGLDGWIRCIGYACQSMRLAREMRRQDLFHVHVHMANNGATVAMLACCFDRKLSYSLSIHGSAEFYRIFSWYLGEKVNNSRFVRCISQFCEGQVKTWSLPATWQRFHIVHCGVTVPEVVEISHTEVAQLRIITIGRFESIKGYPVLLDACRLLKDRGVCFRLTMVGGGELSSLLPEMVIRMGLADYVTFTGALGQEDIRAQLRNSDVLVVSSFMEGVPVVLMEAMAAGISVVATAVGGIPELIHDGENGLLVRPNDVDGLAVALAKLYRDQNSRTRMAFSGRKTVISEFEITATGKRMAELFRKYLV